MGLNKEKIFKLAKGYYGRGKSCISIAKGRVEKALQYSYKSRRLRKRDMRKSWIMQINAASREYNIAYSQLICGLKYARMNMNRKILSELARMEPLSFGAMVQQVQQIGQITPRKVETLGHVQTSIVTNFIRKGSRKHVRAAMKAIRIDKALQEANASQQTPTPAPHTASAMAAPFRMWTTNTTTFSSPTLHSANSSSTLQARCANPSSTFSTAAFSSSPYSSCSPSASASLSASCSSSMHIPTCSELAKLLMERRVACEPLPQY